MTQSSQTDVTPDASKAKQVEAPASDMSASYEQPIWKSAPAAQRAPRSLTPPQVLQLQRTIGNRAASNILQPPMAVPEISASPSEMVQRRSATVKGKSIGKTSIRDARNQIVAKVAKGVVLDVDDSNQRLIGAKNYYRVNVGDEDVDTLFTEVTSAFGDEVYIETDAVTLGPVQAPEADDDDDADGPDGAEAADGAESDPASLEIELFGGNKLTITPEGAELAGEIEESLEADLPGVDISIAIPIPAAPGVYIEAGLTITPSLGMSAKGAYSLAKSATETKFTISGEISGTTGLEITAKGLVGVGLANVAGLSAGLFAEAKASAELTGKLVGEVVKKTDKSWKSSSLKLDLAAEASIVGAVGAMVEAKLGPMTASKKYKVAEKEFAKFEWERNGLSIQKDGTSLASVMPTFDDFKMAVTKDSDSPLTEVVDPRAPLLGSGPRSDSSM